MSFASAVFLINTTQIQALMADDDEDNLALFQENEPLTHPHSSPGQYRFPQSKSLFRLQLR